MAVMSKVTEIILRLQMSMSQSEISRKTGIAQTKISRWASGASAAGADDALKLLALDQELSMASQAAIPSTAQ